MSFFEIAKNYRDNGLSVFGVNNRKSFSTKWTALQSRYPTDIELLNDFGQKSCKYLAIVCGKISGNIEVIDVDSKNDSSGTIWEKLWARILDYYNQHPPFALVETPSGGMHLYYTCDEVSGNQVLAKLLSNPKHQVIETRGEKGIIFASPTEGYKPLDDKFPFNLPHISVDEREDILTICREFNEVFKEEEPVRLKKSSVYKHTPWDHYNNDDHFMDVLIENQWVKSHSSGPWDYWRRPGKDEGHSASWNRELRQFYVFSSSTEFTTERGLRPFDIYKEIKHKGDVPAAVRELRTLNYGRHFSGPEEDFIQKAITRFNLGDLIEEIKEMERLSFDQQFRDQPGVDMDQLLEAAMSRSIDGMDVYWIEDPKTGKLNIELSALADFLDKRGFRLLVDDEDSKDYLLVQICYEIHLIEYIAPDKFAKYLESCLYEAEHQTSIRKLRNLIIGISDEVYGKVFRFMKRVNLKDLKLLKHAGDADTQYFAFSNGVFKVDKDDIAPIRYDELPHNVLMWKTDIKNFDYVISDIETEEEFNQSVVWLYFKRICGITKDIQHLDHQNELPKLYPELANRFYALLTTVGYMLSTYRNTDEPFMPILEEDIKTAAKGGGTGKGLLVNIIGLLRNLVILPCKNWTPAKSFAFELIKVTTDIVHLDDYDPKKFSIADLNNVVTGGINVENKYERTFVIPFETSPKFIVSTNYTVSDTADHEARRQKKLYLKRYFNKNYRPFHEFNKEIGRGKNWTEDDMQISYNILIYCLQNYMKSGVIDFKPTENVIHKSIIEGYGQEFFDYMNDFFQEQKGKWVHKLHAYNAFLDSSGISKNHFGIKKFNLGLEVYGVKMGLNFKAEKNKSRNFGFRDNFYFIFTDTASEFPEMTLENMVENLGVENDPVTF